LIDKDTKVSKSNQPMFENQPKPLNHPEAQIPCLYLAVTGMPKSQVTDWRLVTSWERAYGKSLRQERFAQERAVSLSIPHEHTSRADHEPFGTISFR
jgi:hypothetical protein